jgi:hypothetical protein
LLRKKGPKSKNPSNTIIGLDSFSEDGQSMGEPLDKTLLSTPPILDFTLSIPSTTTKVQYVYDTRPKPSLYDIPLC